MGMKQICAIDCARRREKMTIKQKKKEYIQNAIDFSRKISIIEAVRLADANFKKVKEAFARETEKDALGTAVWEEIGVNMEEKTKTRPLLNKNAKPMNKEQSQEGELTKEEIEEIDKMIEEESKLITERIDQLVARKEHPPGSERLHATLSVLTERSAEGRVLLRCLTEHVGCLLSGDPGRGSYSVLARMFMAADEKKEDKQ